MKKEINFQHTTVDMRQVESLPELRKAFYPQRSQNLLHKFIYEVATIYSCLWQEKQAKECSKITGARDC